MCCSQPTVDLWFKASKLTLEEKVKIVTGLGYQGGRCSGNIPPVGGNFSGLCIQESALGVGQADFVTAFPAGINTAATWKYSLFRARGVAIGKEHLAKGVNVALTPMVNLARIPNGGRNWEGFGADPFLVSAAAYETIIGVQAMGVQAVAKSFINNEQQTQRDKYNANVDDRTQHEIYAAPFLRSVMAGVASVMCSSNLVNGTYACENSQLLRSMLKIEFDFRGFVMSDWYATHSTNSSVNGLDMTMPGDITPGSGTSYFGAKLVSAVKDGTVPESWLDGMVTRILGAWNFLGQNTTSFPATNFNSYQPFDPATNEHIDVQADHDTLVRQIDAASAILLKNVDSALPLKMPRTLVLVGSDAGPAHVAGPNWFNNQAGVDGILATGWGPGSVIFPYLVSPYEAIQARARVDQTTLSWFFDDFDLVGAGSAAIDKDAAIVFLQSDSGDESNTVDGNTGDRHNLTAWHNGDALVLAVAAQNKNTIVVVHSVGPLIIEPWIDNPNVTAVIWAGLGGTETGNGLVDVLYGAVNPSGRLPYTIAKSLSDYPATVETDTINYSEGLFIDYRHFDAANIAPRYEFGFGLSYTEFKYSDLSIVQNVYPESPYTKFESDWSAGIPVQGHSTDLWLHRVAFNVTFTVQNTGAVAGTEIPQIYVHFPVTAGEPPSVLRGFWDIELQPGEKQSVMRTLSRYDLSYWDVVHQAWLRASGVYSLSVGASSRDLRLNGNLPL
ncbi:glycoside hydrolase family 3 protein [Lactarius akahatsu]|uniref:beta-glucosidase n=1 Tax=Lactarius akahatsu TaxID=416441 RepID=A0AAD4LLB4_9AGAM|nr:glycoside hydrolase family 3 protein [Lactarius akahatsu]